LFWELADLGQKSPLCPLSLLFLILDFKSEQNREINGLLLNA